MILSRTRQKKVEVERHTIFFVLFLQTGIISQKIIKSHIWKAKNDLRFRSSVMIAIVDHHQYRGARGAMIHFTFLSPYIPMSLTDKQCL